MKIVINTCYGGYRLSKAAYDYMGLEFDRYGRAFYDDRTNHKLIECVQALCNKANVRYASLKIVEVPDGIEWTLTHNVGDYQIEEKHRIWM